VVRSDARRNIDRILDAAISVLAEAPGATLGEVADASGLHRATLHRHFTTREDLLRALYARAGDEAEAGYWGARPEDGEFGEALRRVLHVALELSDRYRVLLGANDPEFTRHRDRAAKPLLAMFERGRATGALRRDVPERWMLLTFRGVLVAAVEAIADGTLTVDEATEAAASSLISGLQAQD
jgi:AcrR family transcriptional regulator